MNQISRPMQIMLAAVLVFAAAWFVLLKPKPAAEPVAAAPVVATTPRPVDAGGAAASSGLGKAVESANNAAATSNATTHSAETQTGATDPTTPAKSAAAPAATTPKSTTPKATTPVATTPRAATPKTTKKATAKKGEARSHAQRHADHVTRLVAKDLKASRAVVVLVSSSKGSEDKILRRRVKKEINRRRGHVKVYLVPVSQVGLYDGLLGSLNLGQTPSTIVIAPSNEAKVLGGLVSTARIDRLTSAALLMKAPTK